jgi:hypothetical protein
MNPGKVSFETELCVNILFFPTTCDTHHTGIYSPASEVLLFVS